MGSHLLCFAHAPADSCECLDLMQGDLAKKRRRASGFGGASGFRCVGSNVEGLGVRGLGFLRVYSQRDPEAHRP